MKTKNSIVSDVIYSMDAIGYSPTHYHNGEHVPYGGSIAFRSTVTGAKDLFFDSWEKAADWLKLTDSWRPVNH